MAVHLHPLKAFRVLALVCLLPGCTNETPDDLESEPAQVDVLPNNILNNGTERLHVPIWPGEAPSHVAATYRNGSVDWIYYDVQSDAMWMLPGGQGEPLQVFADWGADVEGDRDIRTVSAAWLDSGEMHLYVVETRAEPILGTHEAFGFHAWWSPSGSGSEAVHPPALPDIWDWMATGIRSDGQAVSLALGSFGASDLFLPTEQERGVVYVTTGGAFASRTELTGYNVQRAIPWDGDVIACGGRHQGGEVAIARRNTQWQWEPVATSSAAMPSCDVAAGSDLKVFFYGLPLVGAGGGGEPGSGDSSEYQVAHWRDGIWDVEALGRDPFRGQWIMATPDEHFIVSYSQGGTHNQEVLLFNGTQWTIGLSASGGDPDVVTSSLNPMMIVDGARSDLWNHDGWAVLELVR